MEPALLGQAESMKLTVVSHACVTPVNQSFYAEVERLTGWSIELVVPASWKTAYGSTISGSRWKDLKAQIFPVPVWGAGNIPLHLYRSWFVSYLRRSKPQAIYVHHEPYGLATAQVYLANSATIGVPIGNYAAQNIYKKYPIPFRWIEHSVLQHTDYSFPVTEGALSVLRAKGYAGPAQVLPLPVDGTIYYPTPEKAKLLRERFGLAPDEFVIGYLGRLVQEKGIATLLLAIRQLPNSRWRCVIVGSGDYEAALKKIVTENELSDRVIFVGYVPHEEAPVWLGLFNVLVLPSESSANWTEQFGRVLVEANACGTAVIGTNCGEIAAVITSTSGGIVVPEANASELAKAITLMMNDPIQTEAYETQGREAVKKKYDQTYIARLFVSEISAALDPK
jgi:glycosyltransferase involved in cell wall biosynthesis